VLLIRITKGVENQGLAPARTTGASPTVPETDRRRAVPTKNGSTR
jgi:hypothetical protein